MNTANTKLQIEARVPPQSLLYAPSRPSGRLVVVISDVLGEGELAGRIWSLAQGHGLGVLLFGICPT